MLKKLISQFCLHEHQGFEISIIFHGSHNLNHNQHYHFHELKKVEHNNTLEKNFFQSLDIELISMG
jgi:hypothetical protein